MLSDHALFVHTTHSLLTTVAWMSAFWPNSADEKQGVMPAHVKAYQTVAVEIDLAAGNTSVGSTPNRPTQEPLLLIPIALRTIHALGYSITTSI